LSTNFVGPVLIWSHFVHWVFGKRQGGQRLCLVGSSEKVQEAGWSLRQSIYTLRRSRTWSVQMFKHADGSCNRRDLAICVNCQVHDERTFQWRDLSHINVPMQRNFQPKQRSAQRKGSKETEFNNLCEEAGFSKMALQSLTL